MPKKAPTGRALVIVESPTKAKTIGKFLGRDYMIEASVGHIRDLPENKKQVPEEFQKEPWARLGVNTDDNFQPVYVVPEAKKKQVQKLRGLVKEASEIYLATDEDREGEAISWHLAEVLKPKVPIHRMVFHEITQKAIREALANPRDIDDRLVRAQETRRILDRLYGYDLSDLLLKSIRQKGSTAGRVQSVALRLLVDRERERIAFHSATYWDLLAAYAKQPNGSPFQATLVTVDGRKVPSAKDFDASTGLPKDKNLLILSEQEALDLRKRLETAEWKVKDVDEKPESSKPYAPFTTSTLQMEGSRRLGFSSDRTMRVAQQLYENGHITYMRTDSTTLSEEAITAARDLVKSEYGANYLPDQPRRYATKVKNAQEAHEAIRPAMHFRTPESMRAELDNDQLRLYELIWKRTIASQMVDARIRRTTVLVTGNGADFRASGKRIEFPGYLRAYVEGSDDPEAELADRETVLPKLEVGEPLDCTHLEAKSHTTQPPARYTDSTLVKELEARGIGRPSTYAETIRKLLDPKRSYGFRKGKAMVPTWKAFVVVGVLEEHFPDLVDYAFTARMLEDLDAISRGENDSKGYLRDFYLGSNGATNREGLKQRVTAKTGQIDIEGSTSFPVGQPDEGPAIMLRVSSNGPYLTQGDRKADVPPELPPEELNIEKALELLERSSKGDEPLGRDEKTAKPVYLKSGRFGPYVQLGESDDPDRKTASLLPDMQFEDIDIAAALRLLELPRTVGTHPEKGEPIVAMAGRYGPYLKCGTETRSLPKGTSPLEVTLEEAIHILAQPKSAGRGRGAPREPLKTFEVPTETGEPIKLFEGRYGPYITDGEANATVPKSIKLEELTAQQALELIVAKRATGTVKPKKKAAKAAGKKAAKKASKKAAKKKA
jgi:DNA topoisomerase-1